MTRNELIRSFVNTAGLGLEVGPGFSPIFPKSAGYNVHTLDQASAEELRAKYAPMGVDISAIETVDYVSDGRPIHELVPGRHCYDYIAASHVIQQTTDFVGFFESCQKLLKKTGVVILAVPDKRYCFNALQVTTSTGDVLQAHYELRSRPAPARVFDFFANYSRRDGQDIWHSQAAGPAQLLGDLENAKAQFDKSLIPGGEYIHIHGWRFTPASFRLLIQDLNSLGALSIKESGLHQNGTSEFLIALSPMGPGSGLTRFDLIREAIQEQAEGDAQTLADADRIPTPVPA